MTVGDTLTSRERVEQAMVSLDAVAAELMNKKPNLNTIARHVRFAQGVLEGVVEGPAEKVPYTTLYARARAIAYANDADWGAVLDHENREPKIVDVRAEIVYTLRTMGGTWKSIGAVLGRRRSSVIWYGNRKTQHFGLKPQGTGRP